MTCDNASANNVMIDELEEMLAGFPGCGARSRCFCHIINLVAKALLRQFEPPKPKKGKKTNKNEADLAEDDSDDPSLDEWDKELRELMEDLDFDDELAQGQIDDDDEGMWDVNEEIDEASRADMRQRVRPVKTMLLKVSTRAVPSEYNSPYCGAS